MTQQHEHHSILSFKSNLKLNRSHIHCSSTIKRRTLLLHLITMASAHDNTDGNSTPVCQARKVLRRMVEDGRVVEANDPDDEKYRSNISGVPLKY
jgi:hypothetical protein